MKDRRAVLIVNTKSRRGRDWFGTCRTHLLSLGIELEHAATFRTIRELVGEAASAVARQTPLVIAGGGDGTFSAIARLFVGSSSTLGVLPLGTGNQFARDLGISMDPLRACEVALEGKPVCVDLGTAANDYFLNVATVGVSTLIAQNLTPEAKRRFGRFVYAAALVNGLRRARPFHVRLETENGVFETQTLQLVIGNGRYHAGPFPITPSASITRGKLALYCVATTSKATFLKMALYLAAGRHVELPEVHWQETSGGRLITRPVVPMTIDGEVCARTPVQFGIAPAALKVMAPLDFEG